MSEDKKVRLGLVGCGKFAGVVATSVKTSAGAELITCFDPVPERRAAYSKTYGCDQAKSFEDLVSRKDIEGVLLVSPNAIHREQAEWAAANGKHVYVEKPIANTIADGKRIIEACEKAGVVLMVGHYARRIASIRKAKELMDAGAIGKPVSIESSVSRETGFQLTPGHFRWRADDSGCPGGPIMSMGIHHVDTFRYLFGPVRTVFAFFNKLYIPAEIDDITTAVCRFESGTLGYVGSSYASPKTRWMRVNGTEANLIWTVHYPVTPYAEYPGGILDIDQRCQLTLAEKDKEPRDIASTPGMPYREEIDEFARCIRTGDRPETDGPVALAALAFIRAAIESAKTGKSVELEV
jgi:predicted dehydrogenase